jgi:hypothetical protein
VTLSTRHLLLIVVLLVSLALRIVLVLEGGQFFWPDEGRYDEARKVVVAIAAGDTTDVAERLDGRAHPLFKILALAPAAIEYNTVYDPRIPAMFFVVFSLLNIWLIGVIARDLGAGDGEALLASTLFATSTTAFYFVRHLLPYDAAMTLALVAMHLGLSPQRRAGRAFAAGVVAGAAFLMHAGHWTLGGVVLVLPLMRIARWRDRIAQAAWAGGGLLACMALAIGLSQLANGDFLDGLIKHTGDVNQGVLSEGSRLPFEYFWHAERGILIVWLGASAWGGWQMLRSSSTPRIATGLAGLVLVYGALAILSSGVELWVVFGRLARQMVPFFCLITAGLLESMRRSPVVGMRATAAVGLVLIVVQAGVNFSGPLSLQFPNEFRAELSQEPGSPGNLGAALWQNVRHLYPGPEPAVVPPGYVVAKETMHPLEFLPYQYEGYTPDERAVLRASDIRMRLLVPTP